MENKNNTIKRSKEVHDMLEQYCTRESKWSGNTIIDNEACLKGSYAGKKDWSCDIIIYEDVQTKTLIHEHLHARSISYYSPSEYMLNRKIEEASVELYAQEICKVNRIKYIPAYENWVSRLRQINSILAIFDNDFEFAKALFDIDVLSRWKWLSDKIDEYIKEKKLSNSETLELRTLINELYQG